MGKFLGISDNPVSTISSALAQFTIKESEVLTIKHYYFEQLLYSFGL